MTCTRSGRRASVWPLPLAALLLCSAAVAAPPRIISTLEGFNEGWRVGNLPARHRASAPRSHAATYDDAFGDPAGSLRVVDEAEETAIHAPVDFLGDKRAYYGGRLRYGIVVRGSDGVNYGEAVLRSEAQSLFYVGDTIPRVATSGGPEAFEYRTIPLGKRGWHVGSIDGPPATREEMIEVLRALTGLYIRTEWKVGPDDTSVDTIIMENGEPTSEVAFAEPVVSKSESGSTVRLTLERTGTFRGAAAVDIEAVGGTATEGDDFRAVADTARWDDGAGGARTVTVSLEDDTTDEGTETVLVGLTNLQNLNLGDDDVATVRIRDDDLPSIVSFDTTTRTIAEGASTTFRVVLNHVSGQTITAPFTVQYGTASGGDFASITASPLVFTPGKLSQTITVVSKPDGTAEGGETLTLQLGVPTNALLGAQSSAGLTVTDP
ncbi:MAG TPA: Calx-beta domain-containing protein [Nevskiaceae bacterium]|nr:Calx-beta domain-containing protein [Nevskiaceae bacterium]